MPYWRLYYHIVWATKHRQSLITPEIEAIIFPAIVRKGREMDVFVYALNGTADHVHLVCAIRPRFSISEFISQIKDHSSFSVKDRAGTEFAWQSGYGIHSFGERDLDFVIDYVKRQKEHHAADSVFRRWEICSEEDDGPIPVIPDQPASEE